MSNIVKAFLDEMSFGEFERAWDNIDESERPKLVSSLETACANALTEGGTVEKLYGVYMSKNGTIYSDEDLGAMELADLIGEKAGSRETLYVIDDGRDRVIRKGLWESDLFVVVDNKSDHIILTGHRIHPDGGSQWRVSGLSRVWNQEELAVHLIDMESVEISFIER